MRNKRPSRGRKHLASLTLSIISGLAVSVLQASAATLRLPDGIYPYSVVEQDLPVVLREFGHNVGINVDVSPNVQGKLRGRLPRTSAKEFLDNICESYALDWYYDGYTLHVSTGDERITRFLSLRTFTLADLNNALHGLAFYDERYLVKAGPNGKTAIASGPPRYVDLIAQTILALPNPEKLRLAAHSQAVSQTVVYRGAAMAIVKFAAETAAPVSNK